jgi:DNA methylase
MRLQQWGGKRDQPSDRRLKAYGETSAYLKARMARDCPDILKRYRRGEFKSLRAAAVEAGIVKPRRRWISITGHENNADMILDAAKLHIPDGAIVADVTYGQGAFWTKTDTTRFKFLPSDLLTCAERPYDFRNLPYDDGSIDIVVFDPPYIHTTGTHMTERRYNGGTTNGLTHAGIVELYEDGMREAARVLKPNGQLWVKCKDEIESGRQRWTHMEIEKIALRLSMFGKDFFVVTPKSRTAINGPWKTQRHARKTHSYMWVFQRKRVEGAGDIGRMRKHGERARG